MSLEHKAAVLTWIESLGIRAPEKLYLKIKEHIAEYGFTETPSKKPVTVTKIPESTCESCE